MARLFSREICGPESGRVGWRGGREASPRLSREGLAGGLGRWRGRGRVVRGGPLQLGRKLGALEALQLPRRAPLNRPRGAGPGNLAPALEADPSRAGAGWPLAPRPRSNVMAGPRRGLGSPPGQGCLCADAADPCSRAANPFRLTALAGWGQEAWEPGAGLGVGGWGRGGRGGGERWGGRHPVETRLLPTVLFQPST